MVRDISGACFLIDGNKEEYLGRDSITASKIMEERVGKAILRIYNRIEESVCVEEHSFLDGERVEYNIFHVSNDEIRRLYAVLEERSN